MAKTIVLGATGWQEAYSERTRGDLTRLIFSLASHHDWAIVIAGQSWRHAASTPNLSPRLASPEMTPDRWASLVNAKPS